jgi:hypothetical protein
VKVKLRKETEQKYGNVNKTGRKERVKGRNWWIMYATVYLIFKVHESWMISLTWKFSWEETETLRDNIKTDITETDECDCFNLFRELSSDVLLWTIRRMSGFDKARNIFISKVSANCTNTGKKSLHRIWRRWPDIRLERLRKTKNLSSVAVVRPRFEPDSPRVPRTVTQRYATLILSAASQFVG